MFPCTLSSRYQEKADPWIIHGRLLSACLTWFRSLAEMIRANSRKQRGRRVYKTKKCIFLKYLDGALIHSLHEHLNQLRKLTNPSELITLTQFSSLWILFQLLRDCESAGAVQSSSSETETLRIRSGGH